MILSHTGATSTYLGVVFGNTRQGSSQTYRECRYKIPG